MSFIEIYKNACKTSRFTPKRDLYKAVDVLREILDISLKDYPIDIFSVIKCLHRYINIRYESFRDKSFGGFLIKNGSDDTSHIILNKNLAYPDWTFGCAHELIHYFCHDSENTYLIRPNSEKFNDIYEWQANEGAAELLLPYKIFIKEYFESMDYYKNESDTVKGIARAYHVREKVVNYRINNLAYEMVQYKAGVPLKEIELVSKRKLRELGYGKRLV